MVGVGYAYVGGSAGGDVRYNVVVYLAVVGVQAEIYGNVRVERLEIRYRLFVNRGLSFVGVVFRPERYLVVFTLVKAVGNGELFKSSASVTGREGKTRRRRDECKCKRELFHPFVPPLATPAIIFLRNMRNSTMSGTDITTTAAIIAGMFSLPKPFSRIS